MHAEKIRQVADLLGVPVKGPQSGWMTLGCPFAPTHHKSGTDRNPSMRVEVRPQGLSRWRCWSCGKGGSLGEVAVELQVYGYKTQFGELYRLFGEEQDGMGLTVLGASHDGASGPPPVIPEEYLDAHKLAWLSPAGYQYLIGRGVELGAMQRWELRYDVQRQRVVFPIRDFGGSLRGAQGRTILPGVNPKYLHYAYPDEKGPDGKQLGTVYGHHFWYGEDKIDFERPLVLVEGPLDAVHVDTTYQNVLAACGSAVLTQEKLDRIAPVAKVVTFFDPDDAGDVARERIQHWCYKKRICLHARPPKGRDPGSLDPQEIADLLWSLVAD